MKKSFEIIFIVLSFLLFSGCTSTRGEVESKEIISYDYEEVKDEIIRFHVIANSDSDKDQELKLNVRDEVIKYLEPLLKESKSIDESRKILKKNDAKVKDIAKKVIKDNGYNYKIKTELSNENFPEKVYGNISLPQGKYEAYRILIENAEGQNWWCVMFPPLCFVDVTKGEVAYDETEKRMNNILEKKVHDETKENSKKEVNLKLKSVEVLKDIF